MILLICNSLSIPFRTQGIEDIRFEIEKTQAFEGTSRHERERLTLKEVTHDAKTKTISVTFDPPVTPGKTFTIALRPVRNPEIGGVYLFDWYRCLSMSQS